MLHHVPQCLIDDGLMLARIAYLDFVTLKIRNNHVLALLAVALAILVFDYMQSKDVARAGVLIGVSAVVFGCAKGRGRNRICAGIGALPGADV